MPEPISSPLTGRLGKAPSFTRTQNHTTRSLGTGSSNSRITTETFRTRTISTSITLGSTRARLSLSGAAQASTTGLNNSTTTKRTSTVRAPTPKTSAESNIRSVSARPSLKRKMAKKRSGTVDIPSRKKTSSVSIMTRIHLTRQVRLADQARKKASHSMTGSIVPPLIHTTLRTLTATPSSTRSSSPRKRRSRRFTRSTNPRRIRTFTTTTEASISGRTSMPGRAGSILAEC